MYQIVETKGICGKPELKYVGMDLAPLFNGISKGTSSYETRESEFIRKNRVLQHLQVEKNAVGRLLALQVTSDEGIVNESIRLRQCIEQVQAIVEMSVFGDGTELDDAAHGIIVSGKAELDEVGVVLLEVGHGGACL